LDNRALIVSKTKDYLKEYYVKIKNSQQWMFSSFTDLLLLNALVLSRNEKKKSEVGANQLSRVRRQVNVSDWIMLE
jgi:hypothetical protein